MKSQFFPLFMLFATVGVCVFFLVLPVPISLAAESGLDIGKIESITGLSEVLNQKENVFKVARPRTDVAISVDHNT